MSEWFVVANSKAAPFFSDTSEKFVEAETADEALRKFRKTYRHPAGLFSAAVWEDATAYHKGQRAVAKWLSDAAKEQANS